MWLLFSAWVGIVGYTLIVLCIPLGISTGRYMTDCWRVSVTHAVSVGLVAVFLTLTIGLRLAQLSNWMLGS